MDMFVPTQLHTSLYTLVVNQCAQSYTVFSNTENTSIDLQNALLYQNIVNTTLTGSLRQGVSKQAQSK